MCLAPVGEHLADVPARPALALGFGVLVESGCGWHVEVGLLTAGAGAGPVVVGPAPGVAGAGVGAGALAVVVALGVVGDAGGSVVGGVVGLVAGAVEGSVVVAPAEIVVAPGVVVVVPAGIVVAAGAPSAAVADPAHVVRAVDIASVLARTVTRGRTATWRRRVRRFSSMPDESGRRVLAPVMRRLRVCCA
ncbi:MAG: hypothetical protein QOF83_2128 [Solirubrobacteraceae bacterium]|nr:hypothetical protein [Solirubrobacteraceae bacterium]